MPAAASSADDGDVIVITSSSLSREGKRGRDNNDEKSAKKTNLKKKLKNDDDGSVANKKKQDKRDQKNKVENNGSSSSPPTSSSCIFPVCRVRRPFGVRPGSAIPTLAPPMILSSSSTRPPRCSSNVLLKMFLPMLSRTEKNLLATKIFHQLSAMGSVMSSCQILSQRKLKRKMH